MMSGDTDRQAEKAVSTPEGRARNAREHGLAVQTSRRIRRFPERRGLGIN